MRQYPRSLNKLINELGKLPGIGGKTAQRLAFHILSLSDREAEDLAEAIVGGHTVEDVRRIKQAVTSAEVIVRVNPMHDAGNYRGIPHTSSEEEIESVIDAGADIVMLPYFKTARELSRYVRCVDGRAKTLPLLETAEAAGHIEDILEVDGIDGIHIGINDLSLDQDKIFMFELFVDGTLDALCEKIKEKGIPYGIGGIASPGKGLLPAEYIIREHYRLGSSCAILSRSFCDTSKITNLEEVRDIFNKDLKEIRAIEKEAEVFDEAQFAENHKDVSRRVEQIRESILAKRRTK